LHQLEAGLGLAPSVLGQIDFLQIPPPRSCAVFKKLSKDKRHVVSRLSTSNLVKYFEFLGVDTTSMSRSELIEELLLQIDRAPLL